MRYEVSYRIQKDMAKMVSQKRVLVLLFVFGLILLGVAAFAYWYYLQQWEEIRDLYHAHFRDTAYLLMILGVACIIGSVALFTRIPSDSSSQNVYVVKKCPYCGETLMEDMNFCPYCGKTQGKKKKS
jgi:predicted MFS family arabinose efflux permease